MSVAELESLRYPVGRFRWPEGRASAGEREERIGAIEALPDRLREAVAGLTDERLDTRYREGGWTIRQVVHHVPDSHTNAYVRMSLALTEDEPAIRGYDEAAWAELPFARTAALEPSLTLLDGLHARWTATLRALEPAQLARTWVHPESGRHTVDDLIALYAWHSRHHVAHITGLRERMGW